MNALSTTVPAYLPARFGIQMLQVNDALWRITKPSGEAIGYIARDTTPDGIRFAARRLLPRGNSFLSLGEFWSIDDAIDCFRFA